MVDWGDLVRRAKKQARERTELPLFEVSDLRRKQVWATPAHERRFFERSGRSLELFASFLFQDKKDVGVTGAEAPSQNIKCVSLYILIIKPNFKYRNRLIGCRL
ncbi:hypothetical protein PJIAN_3204 [Paludibacter jiangxiensis]|uniref:Uncharacterized protein n=1 Tax=Paludibacter jiangxiensis TaxID=681398 RepID=A0A170ZPY5_9BACT|nr:hypothetical protein PJIAN_3204 [Paludibacter jiangxiensis]